MRTQIKTLNVEQALPKVFGYQKSCDIRLEIFDAAMHDFIVSIAWNEEKVNVDGFAQGKRVTECAVSIHQAGLGWSKLMPEPGPEGTFIKHWGHFIQFEKKCQITSSIPLFGESLIAMGLQKAFYVSFSGVFDISTWAAKVEIIEF